MRAYNTRFMVTSTHLKLLTRASHWACAVLGMAFLAGCADKQASFHSMDVTGADWGQVYSLPDLDDQRREPKDFQGKVTAVFFGFLYCPDACPNHLTKMLALKERLGADAEKLQVVFITVDPERDEPQALKTFLASFDPSFIGLRGNREETDKTAKDFRVYFKKVPGLKAKENPMSYTIDHTTFSYLFDPSGSLRLVVPHDLPLDQLAKDVQSLLRSSKP
jgi:protein SCO1/2